MSDGIYELKKDEWFPKNEDIFIQRSHNENFNGVVHKHAFIELVYVISGKAVHRIKDASYPVRKGDAILVDYGVPHSFTCEESAADGEPFATFDLLFTPDFFNVTGPGNDEFCSLASSYLFSSLFDDVKKDEIALHLIRTNSAQIRALFEKIHDEYTAKRKGYRNLLRACLLELIVLFFREIDKAQRSFTQTHFALVQKAIEYMRENYRSPISLDDIAYGSFLSKDYFRQVFKKTTGTSISSFIRELRVREACRLLLTTKKSSTEIALECGFNDTKFFYSTFRRIAGMTPSEFRAKNRS